MQDTGASLVAQYLGTRRQAELEPLFEEVCSHDSVSTCLGAGCAKPSLKTFSSCTLKKKDSH